MVLFLTTSLCDYRGTTITFLLEYGDVYPVTLLGKVLASVTAIADIALIAMPAGILTAAYSGAMQGPKANTAGQDDTRQV